MDRWKDRVALVTGASAGIGLGVAEALAEHGMTVVACARNISSIEELARRLAAGQGSVYPVKCDLTKEDEILQMFKTIEQKFKHIDLLVNNAGLAHPDDLISGRTEKWRGMVDLNVIGLSICARETLRLMEQDQIDDGHIVNINSLAGHGISPHLGYIHFYSATKHMVTALTKALNAELRQKKTKIRVTDLSPGAVTTEFQNSFLAESPDLQIAFEQGFSYPFLTVKDIVDAVLYVVSAPPHVTIQQLLIAPTERPA